MVKFDTPTARAKLPARTAAYYVKLQKEVALGFRKRTASSDGQWVARYGNGSTIPYVTQTLGEMLDHAPESRWDAAKEAAMVWASRQAQSVGMEVKALGKMVTVGEACRAWITLLRKDGERDAKGIRRDERVFERFVYEQALADVRLDRLTKAMLLNWREFVRTASKCTQGRKASQVATDGKKRSASTVNRNISVLQAALTHVSKQGLKCNPAVWGEALLKAKNVTGRRDVYLDLGQRRELLDACPAGARAFFQGMCMLPFRPGAVAHLKVEYFDARLRRLFVGKDKAGQNRYLTLPQKTADFFAIQCKDKLPSAPIFMEAGGKQWDNQSWRRAFKAAAQVVKLPKGSCAYSLRHSTITDLLSFHKLDIYTVADLAGTSPEQIKEHYRHELQGHAEDALAKLAVGF